MTGYEYWGERVTQREAIRVLSKRDARQKALDLEDQVFGLKSDLRRAELKAEDESMETLREKVRDRDEFGRKLIRLGLIPDDLVSPSRFVCCPESVNWAEVDRRIADIEAFEAAERGRKWKEK